MEKLRFQLLLPYLDAKFYTGKFIRWMISDRQGKNVYCAFCGNYANGVGHIKKGHFNFNLPICKKHVQQLSKEVANAPFYVEIN